MIHLYKLVAANKLENNDCCNKPFLRVLFAFIVDVVVVVVGIQVDEDFLCPAPDGFLYPKGNLMPSGDKCGGDNVCWCHCETRAKCHRISTKLDCSAKKKITIPIPSNRNANVISLYDLLMQSLNKHTVSWVF